MPARADILAGLAIAGLLLPEAVAYAGLAGLPPQAGVVALFTGLLTYALLGTSRFAIVSATSSSAVVLLAVTSELAGHDMALRLTLAAALVLLCGALFLAAGLARLGGVASFIATPVLRGFSLGLALIIVTGQLLHMLALAPAGHDMAGMLRTLASQWRQGHPPSLLTGLGALLMLRLLQRRSGVPGSLIVILLGIMLGLSGLTSRLGIPEVGSFSLALPQPTLPVLPTDLWLHLGQLALALTLILYAESYGSISTFALRHGERTSANRDLMALGAANLLSGLLQGTPVGAGYSATAANEAAGARSRQAGLMAAAVLLALVLTLLPLISHLPRAVLAAIVIHAVSHSLSLTPLRTYFRWHRDRGIVLTAIAAVLVLGIVNGLLTAIALSLALLLRQLSVPRLSWLGRLGSSHDFVDISRHADARPPAGIAIVRPELPLFFANVNTVLTSIQDHLANERAMHTLVLSLEESADLDGSSLEALAGFAASLRRQGVRLVLARVKDRVRDLLVRADEPALADVVMGWSVDDAVSAALAGLAAPEGSAAEGV
ncbi:MAG: SulP family inorganic anion transporter [Perlucidibaca sp.]